MEKIEVGYSGIPVTGKLAHHKFILYTRSDGTSFQIHGRGSRDYGYSPFEELVSSGPGDLAGFGHLTARVFKSSQKQHDTAVAKPRELVFEGKDLSATFFKLAGMAQGIAEQKTKYNAESNNSNTLVDRVIQWSGGKAPRLGKKYLSPGSVADSEFKPEFYSKLPPVLWGDQTYSKHKDVVDALFKEPLGKTIEQSPAGSAGQIDWRATEENIRKLHKNDRRLAAGIISDLATAKSLNGAWKESFRDKYGDYLIFESEGIKVDELKSQPVATEKPNRNHSSLSTGQGSSIGTPSLEAEYFAKSNVAQSAPVGRDRNPFNLRQPNLKQQVEVLEQSPMRARQMILAAKRNPAHFGL